MFVGICFSIKRYSHKLLAFILKPIALSEVVQHVYKLHPGIEANHVALSPVAPKPILTNDITKIVHISEDNLHPMRLAFQTLLGLNQIV